MKTTASRKLFIMCVLAVLLTFFYMSLGGNTNYGALVNSKISKEELEDMRKNNGNVYFVLNQGEKEKREEKTKKEEAPKRENKTKFTIVNHEISEGELKDVSNEEEKVQVEPEPQREAKPNEDRKANLKYILQWTSPKGVPFVYMGQGQQNFIDRKCRFTNCFVTADRNYLDGDYTKFDAIAFAGPEVIHHNKYSLPQKRSPHQKFAFATIESADNYPVCSSLFDGFFNWTWTYKLDSESKWGYIVVRDLNGKIIGPKQNMHWIKPDDMKPVSDDLKSIFQRKTKTAAWFVSNCNTIRDREKLVKDLNMVLKDKYRRSIDIYGGCGDLKCSRDDENECDRMIEKNYFFYLAFENSFSEDYVTEKIMHALAFNAIPIVFGGANYSRFLPERSYINARDHDVKKLAEIMNELSNDIDKYSEYFRWKNHYRFHRTVADGETDDYCSICRLLNDEEKVKTKTVYEDFKKWWTPPHKC